MLRDLDVVTCDGESRESSQVSILNLKHKDVLVCLIEMQYVFSRLFYIGAETRIADQEVFE